MKYVDEFRDGRFARSLAQAIAREVDPGRTYHLMEFCGGHTHAVSRYGIADLLPPGVHMIHGPGCPVCVLPIGRIVATGTARTLSKAERAAYDAPFPNATYKAGARQFPALVPTSPNDPAAPANTRAWEALGRWEKPFLTLFGAGDPILGKADKPLQEHVPGAAGQPHDRVRGGHFVQEDSGAEIARRVLAWRTARSQ